METKSKYFPNTRKGKQDASDYLSWLELTVSNYQFKIDRDHKNRYYVTLRQEEDSGWGHIHISNSGIKSHKRITERRIAEVINDEYPLEQWLKLKEVLEGLDLNLLKYVAEKKVPLHKFVDYIIKKKLAGKFE